MCAMLTTDFRDAIATVEAYARTPFDKLLVLGAGRLEHERGLVADVVVAVEWADDRLADLSRLPRVVPIKYDFSRIHEIVPPDVFDAVVLFDAIEHLEKDSALELIDYLKRVIRKQILMFVPIQPEIEDVGAEIRMQQAQVDCHGEMGHHLSTWTPQEMEALGFEGEVSPGYHVDKGWGAMVCVLNLADGSSTTPDTR